MVGRAAFSIDQMNDRRAELRGIVREARKLLESPDADDFQKWRITSFNIELPLLMRTFEGTSIYTISIISGFP